MLVWGAAQTVAMDAVAGENDEREYSGMRFSGCLKNSFEPILGQCEIPADAVRIMFAPSDRVSE